MSDFKVVNKRYSFSTRGEIEFVDLTDKVQEAVSASGIRNGVVHVFAPHATGILILTEKDYALLNDIKAFLEEIVPKRGAYQHPSNAHAHLRSMLLPPDKTLPSDRWASGVWNMAISALCRNRCLLAETNRGYTSHGRTLTRLPLPQPLAHLFFLQKHS